MLREAKQKIAALIDWLKAVKTELSKPQPPTLVELLSAYYDKRNKGAYSSKSHHPQGWQNHICFLQRNKDQGRSVNAPTFFKSISI